MAHGSYAPGRSDGGPVIVDATTAYGALAGGVHTGARAKHDVLIREIAADQVSRLPLAAHTMDNSFHNAHGGFWNYGSHLESMQGLLFLASGQELPLPGTGTWENHLEPAASAPVVTSAASSAYAAAQAAAAAGDSDIPRPSSVMSSMPDSNGCFVPDSFPRRVQPPAADVTCGLDPFHAWGRAQAAAAVGAPHPPKHADTSGNFPRHCQAMSGSSASNLALHQQRDWLSSRTSAAPVAPSPYDDRKLQQALFFPPSAHARATGPMGAVAQTPGFSLPSADQTALAHARDAPGAHHYAAAPVNIPMSQPQRHWGSAAGGAHAQYGSAQQRPATMRQQHDHHAASQQMQPHPGRGTQQKSCPQQGNSTQQRGSRRKAEGRGSRGCRGSGQNGNGGQGRGSGGSGGHNKQRPSAVRPQPPPWAAPGWDPMKGVTATKNMEGTSPTGTGVFLPGGVSQKENKDAAQPMALPSRQTGRTKAKARSANDPQDQGTLPEEWVY